jgi:GT2 family glycosyltransferase/glycosyltransferase involved in cell wall biosynthesis
MSRIESAVVSASARSAHLDADWYLSRYPEVAKFGLSAEEHYSKVGAFIGYDPGPNFNTREYLRANPDVALAGLNPLAHFEENGTAKSSETNAASTIDMPEGFLGRIDIVVPVYNALDDVKVCLASLSHAPSDYQLRVIVVNDGSEPETTAWLRSAVNDLSHERVSFTLIEHEQNMGYTVTVNDGLRASTAPYIVTLNSDTIVTPHWVDGLVRCMHSSHEIGICGPLSNAANWQSVPDLYDESGKFAINALPKGMTAADMAQLVLASSRRDYPRTRFVNGFCFMIRREVINSIGYMDEKAFPTGYGEENDFCIRAQDAGYALAYADDTYVFHAKSKSFGHERRIALSKAGREALNSKHGKARMAALTSEIKDTRDMDAVRGRIKKSLGLEIQGAALSLLTSQKILFILPGKGGGGGAHSVVQEAIAARRLGIEVNIAVMEEHCANFCKLYSDVPGVSQIFVGYTPASLVKTASAYDVVVATIYKSVQLLKAIVDDCPWILPAYYVQDYEPLFFDEGSEDWQAARESYTLVPNAVLFAKTDWIREQVRINHGVEVQKVLPSIDHDVYKPTLSQRASSSIRITAMIRPKTPRRGALRTMQLLQRLSQEYSDKISISVFGCDPDDSAYLELPRDFNFRNAGVLQRPAVAQLLQQTDIFIDLSDYQAFGRTAAEAMACGALSVVPRAGGAEEYAIDEVNASVVDTTNPDACFEAIKSLLDNLDKVQEMRLAGLAAVSAYSPRRAAISELLVLVRPLAKLREVHASPKRQPAPLNVPVPRNNYLVYLKWSLCAARTRRLLLFPVAKWRRKYSRLARELSAEINSIQQREKLAREYFKSR